MAKELDNVQRINGELKRIYRQANKRYFDNSLPDVQITLQKDASAYGYITIGNWWNVNGTEQRELNISTMYINRPIEETVATIIHEMSHIYAMENGIKDTSNNGVYHNKKFKAIAEGKGHLKIEHREKYGWTRTSPTEETINFCIDINARDIKAYRKGGYTPTNTTGTTGKVKGGGEEETKKKSSTRKYICPCCKNSFRATKDINVLCIDCEEQYIKVE